MVFDEAVWSEDFVGKTLLTMSINLRRVYTPVRRDDGARILIDRLWPRGIKKEDAQIDRWMRGLAPSTRLRKWFSHKPERWEQFRQRYIAELRAHKAELRDLRMLARRRPVTLVYSARDTEHNDAVVLREVLLRGTRQEVNRYKRVATRRQPARSTRFHGRTAHSHQHQ